MSSLVVWPLALGLSFFAAGLYTYRYELFAATAGGRSRLLSLEPVFIASALATFSGEHFTEARPAQPFALVPSVPAANFNMRLGAQSLAGRRCEGEHRTSPTTGRN